MREIKFRAWDKKNKQMSQPFTIDKLVMYEHIFETMFPTFPAYKQLIWLEYTGLKDKNGKEGYQSDITKRRGGEPRYIDWYCGAWWLMYKDGRNDRPLYGNLSEREIIGNIYENPELVK